jgi:cobyrinic acid a,c-diamide synthase
VPWSVSAPAIAAILACSYVGARAEAERRATQLQRWRAELAVRLEARSFHFVHSQAPYLLVRVGPGVHGALRERGIAVRRADTFPGLDQSWVRIAVREPATIDGLLAALDDLSADRLPADVVNALG